jgi:CspA family cold shock protein
MATGVVKWFDPLKGFGFIRSDDGEDFFTHARDIGSDWTALVDGTRVEFSIESNQAGRCRRAVGVRKASP